MRILQEQREEMAGGLGQKLSDCWLYVRSDYTVSSAGEIFYAFIGKNSFMPVTDLIDQEDAGILKKAMEEGITEPVEVVTRIRNFVDEGYRNVHIRVMNCDRREEGKVLYRMVIISAEDVYKRMKSLAGNLAKYRYFMSLGNLDYFEYDPKTENYVEYRYINEKAIQLINENIDHFVNRFIKEANGNHEMESQARRLLHNLKENTRSFEMEWKNVTEDGEEVFTIKGGESLNAPGMITGVIIGTGQSENVPYYLDPAGRDAFTGLLNKRAATEYSVHKLSDDDGVTKWMIIVDIDDFKTVNDNFGHAFGDEVIKKVADTLQLVLGSHGAVGRFGGDEFFALLHDVPTRDDLKLLLKVVAREILYAFDSKISVTLSIGVSQYPKDGKDFETLFGKADKSLYIAKEKGKNRHIIYDEKVHGAYTQDSIQFQAASYVASREKRRDMLVSCVVGMNQSGAAFLVNSEKVQQGVMDAFMLDGITIYTDYGRRVLVRHGKYMALPEDRSILAEDPEYMQLYDKDQVLVVSTTNRLAKSCKKAYDQMVEQEIGACVRCIAKKEDKPYVFIDFDMFNMNRKWSDTEIDMLTIFGCSIGQAIVSEGL